MKTKDLFYSTIKYFLALCLVMSLCMVGVADAIASSDVINIKLSPLSPSSLTFWDYVNISFDYYTDKPDGVRIYIRPFTNGSLTPRYSTSGSPLYPSTILSGDDAFFTSSGTARFTIRYGEVDVDQLRVRILSADRSRLLREFFIPVAYHFTSKPTDKFELNMMNWSDDYIKYYIWIDGKLVIYDSLDARDGAVCEGSICHQHTPDYKSKTYSFQMVNGVHKIKAIVYSWYYGIFMPVAVLDTTYFEMEGISWGYLHYNGFRSIELGIYDHQIAFL